MRKLLIAAISAALTATAASADSSSLAAPGDCASSIRHLDAGPVSAQPSAPTRGSGSAAGSPIDHFAPIAILGNQRALLPSDLTRTTVQTVDAIAKESLLVDVTRGIVPDNPSILPTDPILPLPGGPLGTLPGDPTPAPPGPVAPLLEPLDPVVGGVLKR